MHFLLLIALFGTVSCGNILLIPNSITPSNKMVMSRLGEELISRGHTVVMWYVGVKHDGFKLPTGIQERFWKVDLEEKYINDMFLHENASIYDAVWDPSVSETVKPAAAWLMTLNMCENVLINRKQEFDKLVLEDFDTVLVDDQYNPCGLLLAGLKKGVYVYWSMTYMRTETAWGNQSPSPPSYIPVPGTGYTDEMDFWQRAYNLLHYIKTIYFHHRIVLRRLDSVFSKYYPALMDSFSIERNASLNFINSPPIFDFARPYMPRVNFVGGLHARNASALAINGPIKSLIDKYGKKKGVVLFTSGHSVQWKKAPRQIIDMFVSVFTNLPEFGFIWQYDGPLIEKLPANVMTQAWVPQQDILGNKHCVAFITMGGLNSVVESMWHAVPVVGIPLFYDQKDNLLRATVRGGGVLIDKPYLSEKSLTRAIRKVTVTDQYKIGASTFQDLLQDVPYTELNHAAFWVEFILRHQEIPHARSGADELNVFQYFLVDVLSFIFACIFLVLCTLYYTVKYSCKVTFFTLKYIFNVILGRKKETTTKSKKEN